MKNVLIGVAAAAALCGPLAATAAPVTLKFDVTATDFVAVQPTSAPTPAVFSGSFELTFDDAIGDILANPGVTGTANWDAGGGLIYSYIGTTLWLGGNAGGGAGGFEPGFEDFWLSIDNAATNPTFAFVRLAGDGVWSTRTGTLTFDAREPATVPEPATASLLALALAGVGFARRRRAAAPVAA